jgi:hypothetical protein
MGQVPQIFLKYSELSERQYQDRQIHFHHLSNLSLGLLMDALNVGFQKNLRYRMTTSLSEIPDNAFIFQPPSTLLAPLKTWGSLKSFFNIDTMNLTLWATDPLYRPQSRANYNNFQMICSINASDVTGRLTGRIPAILVLRPNTGFTPFGQSVKIA